MKNKRSLIVVGGDFYAKDDSTNNCFYSTDGGSTWQIPQASPPGYRSCVEFIRKKSWVTCGLNGVDITNDNGQTWKPVNTTGYHVVRKAKHGNAVFLAGANGRIGKMKW
ncbi:MAG: exo-alpha-sialidase [Chitinophagaceae bacterium]|nr:MAG: exo-alpha-sialidase [Chitinophagaceae bacterium]